MTVTIELCTCSFWLNCLY